MRSRQPAKEPAIVTIEDPKSPISEAYRTIRTNILFSGIDHELKTLMITSAEPMEGKTTTSSNLAVIMAHSGKKVLLVDADLRKPSIHRTFRMLNNEGLTNVITAVPKPAPEGKRSALEFTYSTEEEEENQFEYITSYVKQSPINDLDVLLTGPIPPNPAEILGSQAMARFMTDIQQLYDVILFDTPPLLAVTDAQILATQVNGVVMVVHSGKTTRDKAQKAKGLLETVGANLLGCILNQKKQKKSNYYYYYHSKKL